MTATDLERLTSSTVRRAHIYSRNAILYTVARSWRADAKAEAVAALRTLKAGVDTDTVALAATEIAEIIQTLYGSPGALIASVACGHSRRPDCMGRMIAETVALALEIPYVQLWEDRFVTGSSHPKEFRKLPPLVPMVEPTGRVIVVDDVATSGWHLEEALSGLRERGISASAVAWIGGTIRGEDAAPRARSTSWFAKGWPG